MSVGISTACFYPAATEEALRCVAEAGAKVTEVFFNSPSELEPDFLRRISSIASDSGIRIRSIHPFTSFAEGYILFSQYERRFDDYREFYKKILCRRICDRCENSRAPRRKAAGEYQHGRIRRAS